MTQTKEMRHWVERYHELGLNPIPIKERSKEPNIPETSLCFYQKLPDEIIMEWLRKGLYENVALIGGINNIECFDFDDPQSFKDLGLSEEKLIKQGALVTKTPKQEGRYHVVVRNKNKTSFTKQSRCGIERRVNEHYWLVYPSIHPNGKPYDLLNTHEPQELRLPVEVDADKMWTEWVQELQKKRGTKESHEDTLKNKREYDNSPDCIRSAWENGAKVGQRYYTSLALASWMRQQKIPEDIARAIITEWHKTKNEQTVERPIEDIVKAVEVAYHDKYMTGCTYLKNNTEHCPYQDKKNCRFFNPEDEKNIIVDHAEEVEEKQRTKKRKETKREFHKGFLGDIERLHDKKTCAPLNFSTFLGLQAIGHAMGPHTTHQIQPSKVFHNLYLLLIGASTLSRKTTSQEIARKYFLQDQILPNIGSAEGLLKELVDIPHGILLYGEFSTILRHIHGNGYMSDIKEVFNDLHGCPAIYQRRLSKMKDSVTIEQPYFNFNSTVTPEQFFCYLDDELIYGGCIPRILLVKGETEFRKRGKLDNDVDEKEHEIRSVIRKINDLFDKPVQGFYEHNKVVFEFTDDGLEEFNRIDQELSENPFWDNVEPFVARGSNYLIAIADILLISDMIEDIGVAKFNNLSDLTNISNLTNLYKKYYVSPDTVILPQNCDKVRGTSEVSEVSEVSQASPMRNCHTFLVSAEYVKRSYDIIYPCLEYSKTVTRYVNEDMKIARVQNILERYSPITRTDLARYAKLQKIDLDNAVSTLQDREEAFELKIISKDKQERVLRVYCHRKNIDAKICEECAYKCKYEQREPKVKGYKKGGSF